MDEHSLKVFIVTPESEVFTYQTATLVMLHTINGVIGVMANHSPLLATLLSSEVHIIDKNKNIDKKIEISKGFVEFSDNKLTVLVDSAKIK